MIRRVARVLLFLAAFALAATASDFRFVVLGDRTGGAVPGVFEEAWREIGTVHPAFVITVGDVIEGGPGADARAQWKAVTKIWEPFRIPVFFTPGNHDYWDEASREVWRRETGRDTHYSLDWEGAHFTVLDNSRSGQLDAGQLRYLEEDLAAHRDASPKFVLFHEPFWLVFLKLGSGEFPLHELARRYHVDYVVSGHGHQFVSLARDGVRYIEIGSSGGRMAEAGGFDQGWFYQFGLVEVRGGRAAFEVHELGAPFGRGRVVKIATPRAP